MPRFRVTQILYSYQRYLVEAQNWRDAKAKVEEAAPQDNETNFWRETDGVRLISDPVDGGAEFYGEITFMDSVDGSETFYERE